jgi:hypothetical protein
MNNTSQGGASEGNAADEAVDLGEALALDMHTKKRNHTKAARVAELADALDLGSSGAIRGGSSPPSRTTKPLSIPPTFHTFSGSLLRF